MEREQRYRIVVSERAAQQLVAHASFLGRLNPDLAHKLTADFREAANSLETMPYRTPVLRCGVFSDGKYRKLIFDKWYLLLYQVVEDTVYIEYMIDGRQDYEWLLK